MFSLFYVINDHSITVQLPIYENQNQWFDLCQIQVEKVDVKR
jgi:hypothetical protein